MNEQFSEGEKKNSLENITWSVMAQQTAQAKWSIAQQWNKTQYTDGLRKVVLSLQKRKSAQNKVERNWGNNESRLRD